MNVGKNGMKEELKERTSQPPPQSDQGQGLSIFMGNQEPPGLPKKLM
jgi:hypothetical protein